MHLHNPNIDASNFAFNNFIYKSVLSFQVVSYKSVLSFQFISKRERTNLKSTSFVLVCNYDTEKKTPRKQKREYCCGALG